MESSGLVKNHLQCRRPWLGSWVGTICCRRDKWPTPVSLGFPCGSARKESVCNAGDLGSIPELGRFPWRRERLPTPILWPGEFHGLYSPRGCKKLDMTEWLLLSPVLKRLTFSVATLLDPHSVRSTVPDRALCISSYPVISLVSLWALQSPALCLIHFCIPGYISRLCYMQKCNSLYCNGL